MYRRLITVILTLFLTAGLITNGLYTTANASTEQQDQNETAIAPEPETEVEPEPGPDTDGPDGDCLFDPSLPKCTPGPEGCPEGFYTNEDGQCFPAHDEGCPEGYHSHEDDESGKCIPDSVPCAEDYIMNPDFPSCERKERVCLEHPELDECTTSDGQPQPPKPPQPEPEPEPELEPQTNQTIANQTGNATIITINNAIAQAFSSATYNTNILQHLAQNTLLVGEETVPLQGTIKANDSRLLSTFDPFHLIGGSVIIYLPTSNISLFTPSISTTATSDKMQILALDGDSSQLVMLPSINMPIEGNAYKIVLGEAFQGTNPFTGNQITVDNIKALFLFNGSNQTVTFGYGSSIALLTIVR